MTNGSDAADATEHRHWFQGVPRYAWVVLALAALGWLFDTMDQNLFNLVRQTSVTELLKPYYATPALLDTAAKAAGAQLTAIFLLGWATGGFIFGILGDRLGRTRTMIATICIYALFTGLNALVHTFWQYAACRFLTALGVGGEFAAGTALVAEVWPARSRAMALGTLQASSAIGNIMAASITLILSAASWRWAYAVGAAPALLVLWIRGSVREPEKWQAARNAALSQEKPQELGNILSLWREPILRRNTIAGVLLALAGVGGLWGVGFFLPDLVQTALKPVVLKWPEIMALHGVEHDKAVKTLLNAYKSKASIVQNVGAFFGMFSYAALSQKTGRKPALFLFFILAFLAVQATFHFLHDVPSTYLLAFPLGFCALAPFSAYAVYFPELYPTRLRATGIGFCYNCARLFAALAPFALGSLAKTYASATDESAGLRTAASIIACIYIVGFIGLFLAPETKGKPLPE
jgi:MFS family permease